MRSPQDTSKPQPPARENASNFLDGKAKYIPLALILCGILPRVAQYLHYRALFHDEAVLAAHVLDKSTLQLFGPYRDSMAPGGFMLLTKAVIATIGVNEYAARLVPFLGSLITLLVFYPIRLVPTVPRGNANVTPHIL